jgi:hypothetical protein
MFASQVIATNAENKGVDEGCKASGDGASGMAETEKVASRIARDYDTTEV